MWSKRKADKTEQISSSLRRLENQLQSFIEGNAARLFSFDQNSGDLVNALLRAMHLGTTLGPAGEKIGPNLFFLEVHPAIAEQVSDQSGWLRDLAQALQDNGLENGFIFDSPVSVRVFPDETVPTGSFRVRAIHSLEDLTNTTAIESEPPASELNQQIPANTFLIVDGTRVFPLSRALTNIGRRPDNHLIIDDPRVSRVHAQLRMINGYFVIFDLDSTGGTFVNGERIRQKTLQPGDVISLSGLPLVFGQDTSYPDETQRIANLP